MIIVGADPRRDRRVPRGRRTRPTPRRSSTPRTSSRSTARTRRGRRSRRRSKGASIVIYLGHGNGWPSPYTYDPKYTTKDGFGLNATAGAGDYNNKYYGEPYVATLDLAPDAVVILNHLCYASGNSEPGNAAADRHRRPPARRQLRRRVPEGRRRGRDRRRATAAPTPYIRGLFTTHQSVWRLWRTQRNAIGNFVSYPSARTPARRIYQDPVTPTYGFCRSLAIAEAGVTTDEVISGGLKADRRRSGDACQVPATLRSGPQARRCSPASKPPARRRPRSRPGTRLRVVEQAVSTTAEGTTVPLVAVEGVDDPKIDRLRGDSRPRAQGRDAARGPEPERRHGASRPTATACSTPRRCAAGSPNPCRLEADRHATPPQSGPLHGVRNGLDVQRSPGTDSSRGKRGPRRQIRRHGHRRRRLAQRRRRPRPGRSPSTPSRHSSPRSPRPPATIQWFSPNGDSNRESVAVTATNTEPGSFTVRARERRRDAAEEVERPRASAARHRSRWDGRDSAGRVVPDGTYTLRVTPGGPVGQRRPGGDRTVRVVGAPPCGRPRRGRVLPAGSRLTGQDDDAVVHAWPAR